MICVSQMHDCFPEKTLFYLKVMHRSVNLQEISVNNYFLIQYCPTVLIRESVCVCGGEID